MTATREDYRTMVAALRRLRELDVPGEALTPIEEAVAELWPICPDCGHEVDGEHAAVGLEWWCAECDALCPADPSAVEAGASDPTQEPA